MREFDRRWQLLVRAASRAGETPVPDIPDGARLQRRAAVAGAAAARPWRHPWTSGLAVGLLWAVAMPAARPAWQTARDVLARLAESAPAPPTLSAPALALPHLPPLPDFFSRLRWADPPTEAPPKEIPS
jgi:hypothetical protein